MKVETLPTIPKVGIWGCHVRYIKSKFKKRLNNMINSKVYFIKLSPEFPDTVKGNEGIMDNL